MAILPPQTRKKGPIYKKDRNGQGTNGGGIFDNTFYVPKQNDLQLETTQVTLADVVQLRFFTEYQWLLDFSLYALFVYFITEVSKIMPVPIYYVGPILGRANYFWTWVKKQILVKTILDQSKIIQK